MIFDTTPLVTDRAILAPVTPAEYLVLDDGVGRGVGWSPGGNSFDYNSVGGWSDSYYSQGGIGGNELGC